MTRDELIEASGISLPTYQLDQIFILLARHGASHILMKDETLVPLDEGEAIEGVVVLRPATPADEGDGVFVDGMHCETHESRGWWVGFTDRSMKRRDRVYVPLNTPSEES